MLVILKMRGNPGEPMVDMGDMPAIAPEIAGWINATDVHDARRQAESIGDQRLAQWLFGIEYGMTFPQPGRHELSSGLVGESRYVMLVS